MPPLPPPTNTALLKGDQTIIVIIVLSDNPEYSWENRHWGAAQNIHEGKYNLGGGFKDFLFSPLFGEMIQFDKYFSNGLKPPTINGL